MFQPEFLDREDISALHEGIHQSVFLSASLPTLSQEQPPYWEHHAKVLPGVSHHRGDEVKRWSIEEVANFITMLPGCREQEKVFKEQVSRPGRLLLCYFL